MEEMEARVMVMEPVNIHTIRKIIRRPNRR